MARHVYGSRYRFRVLDRHYIEVDHYLFVVAAHHEKFDCLIGAEVTLLMRHIRQKITEFTTANIGCKLKAIAPANLRAATNDIDHYFVTPMVMRTSLCVLFETDPSDPSAFTARAGKVKRCRTPCARRPAHKRL